MGDAFFAAARVATEAALTWTLASLCLRQAGLGRLRAPLGASLLAGLLIGAGAAQAAAARGLAAGDLALPLQRLRYLLGLALLAGALVTRGAETGLPRSRPGRALAELAWLAGGLLWCLPEGAGLATLLSDLGVLQGRAAPPWLAAAAGLAAAAAGGLLLEGLLARSRIEFAPPPSAVLALLFALKVVGVAALAVESPPLAAGLTDAVARSIHDLFHVGFILLQLPDHPYLRDGVYQVILKALDPRLHAALTAAALCAPLGYAWVAFSRRPGPSLPAPARAPERRIALAAFRRRSRLAGASFAAALALAASAIWSSEARSEELYDPAPEPVVDDGAGWVIAPLGGPLGGPAAGERLRKYVYSAGGRAITFLAVRRPDGALAAALDLCEICQPKGYAQLGREYVFCKYCKTPIPISTVGQPGGCNPVPLPDAVVQGAVLRVRRSSLISAWEKGTADKR